MCFSVLLVFGLLLFSTADAQSSAFVFGRCPNQCANLATTPGLFSSCAPLSQLGCLLLPCGNSSEPSFSCRLESDKPSLAGGAIPGGKIEFEELEVGKPFPIFVDLKAGRVQMPIDIYLLADNTGSMTRTVPKVKEEFTKLINAVSDAPQFKDPYFGVGSFHDEKDGGTDFGFRHLQRLTSSRALAQQAVNKYVAENGGDTDEANLVALYKIATEDKIGWRKGSRKIVVYFGDAPGHEPTCGPFGTLNRNIVADALNKKNISVIAVSLSPSYFDDKTSSLPGCRGPPGAENQAQFITSQTNGNLLDATYKNLVTAISQGVVNLASTFTVDLSDCNGKVESSFVPSLPLTLPQGTTRTVTQTMTVPEKFCDPDTIKDKFECTVKYLESGVFLPPTTLVAKKVKGCS